MNKTAKIHAKGIEIFFKVYEHENGKVQKSGVE